MWELESPVELFGIDKVHLKINGIAKAGEFSQHAIAHAHRTVSFFQKISSGRGIMTDLNGRVRPLFIRNLSMNDHGEGGFLRNSYELQLLVEISLSFKVAISQ